MDQMTTRTEDKDAYDPDFLRIVKLHWRDTWRSAVALAGLVAVIAAVYWVWQPVRRTFSQEFRPVFAGSDVGLYPNGEAFAPTDITAPIIVEQVHTSIGGAEYCTVDEFRSGLLVEQWSDESRWLDLEYQAVLSDTGLTSVDRQRLEREYADRRAAIPVGYRLSFVVPAACRAMPDEIAVKVVLDVLGVWAELSDVRRGVLRHRVDVPTPELLDAGEGLEQQGLVRADLLRAALTKVAKRVDEVLETPGATSIRFAGTRESFAQISHQLTDLVRTRLEPLMIRVGRSTLAESLPWTTETAARAALDQAEAEGRVRTFEQALAQYSGTASPGPRPSTPASSSTRSPSSDVQTLSPQIDQTFIDRIVELSQANAEFRQKLTESLIEANLAAVEAARTTGYYERLLTSMAATARGSASPWPRLSPQEIADRLDAIADEGKALTARFNELFDEFSRVSFRPAAGLFQTVKPVNRELHRGFRLIDVALLSVGVFLAALVLIAGYHWGRHRLQSALA